MSLFEFTQKVEIRFWEIIIPVIDEKGLLMKTALSGKRLMHSKPGLIALLVLVWSTVGLIAGIIIGRLVWMLQLL